MSKINLHNYEAFLIDYLDGNLENADIAQLKAFILVNPQLEIDLNDLNFPSFANESIKVDFKNELKKTDAFIEDEEIINYLENNLPEVQRKLFESKILKDRELASQLTEYKKTILQQEPSITFVTKAEFLRTEDDLILNNPTLSFIENQLSPSGKLQFETELKSSFILQQEVNLFNKTKLEANYSIQYPNKDELKKETKVIALFSFRVLSSIAAAILLLVGLAVVYNFYFSKPQITHEIANNHFNEKLKNTDNQLIASVDSVRGLSNDAIEKSTFIAKKTDNNTNSFNKTNSITELKVPLSNSVAINKIMDAIDTIHNNALVNESKLALANSKLNDTSKETPALAVLNQSKYSKQNYLITEQYEEDDIIASAPEKKSLWQRAVKLAKGINKLGIKSIDGEETPNNNYALSFNAFSVEKR
ncbi:MAG: hypothetical protein Q8T03_06450 [Bacteroidota bacterium]|nr:hypothetical protein [Bacteroidota bacterium]